tara:strand:+ start:115 stop:474 length:360 start_codon:yes stop_codon:yes gene_type:complete
MELAEQGRHCEIIAVVRRTESFANFAANIQRVVVYLSVILLLDVLVAQVEIKRVVGRLPVTDVIALIGRRLVNHTMLFQMDDFLRAILSDIPRTNEGILCQMHAHSWNSIRCSDSVHHK